jgi:hypothetical protein
VPKVPPPDPFFDEATGLAVGKKVEPEIADEIGFFELPWPTPDGPWLVEGVLVAQDGRAVIAEVRVTPFEKPPLRPRATPALRSAPPGGITSAVWKSIRLGEIALSVQRTLNAMPGLLQAWDAHLEEMAQQPTAGTDRRGNRDLGDDWYAWVAHTYLEILARPTGLRPYAELALRMTERRPAQTFAEGNAQRHVRRAADRGFLKLSQGKAGASATWKLDHWQREQRLAEGEPT